MKRFAWTLAAAVLLGTPATAQSWMPVSTGKLGAASYVDSDSLKWTAYGAVAWIKTEMPPTRRAMFAHYIWKATIRCDEQQYMTGTSIFYDAKGEVVGRNTGTEVFEDAAPGTVVAATIENICQVRAFEKSRDAAK